MEGAAGREGRGARVMAKGAKMAGASQGTAQQRAFTQEGEEKKKKGGRKSLHRS